MAGEVFFGDEGGAAGLDAFAGGFEEGGGVVAQVAFAQGGVALFLEGFHGVEDAGVEAGRGVVGEAEVDGDAVGGLEADAVDLAGDAVGLLLKNLAGLGAVFLDEFNALAGSDAVGLKEDVELAESALLVPGFFNGGGADLADAGHVAQAGGFLGKHTKSVGAEGVHDLVGVNFSDAGDEAGPEVFADTVNTGGEGAGEALDFELGTVLGVRSPDALEAEGFAALDAG